MKHLLIIFSLLLTSVSWSEDIYNREDLVFRESEGMYYKKFKEEPILNGTIVGRVQGKIKNGKFEGEWIVYYESGELRNKRNYKDGKVEGEALMYWDNGQLKFKRNYKDGELDGEQLGYYENGQLKVKGNYKDDKKEGEQIYYDADGNGQITSIDNYKDGKNYLKEKGKAVEDIIVRHIGGFNKKAYFL